MLIEIQKSVRNIWSIRAEALVGLHSFTASYTTGKFRTKGKVTLWKKFEAAQEKTVRVFIPLGNSTNVDEHVEAMEKFVCQVYCRKFIGDNLSEVRWHLFTKSPNNGNDLPTTRITFEQHHARQL